MSTLLERQRAAQLTDAQFTGLGLLCTKGEGWRVRIGWCFGGNMSGPIVAPTTMDALVRRGLATVRHDSAKVTAAGRVHYDAVIGGAA